MSLRFILGPAGSGKTYHIMQELAAQIDAEPLGSPLLLIVPQQATFINESQLARSCAAGGFCRADVTSFTRLLRRAAGKKGQQLQPLRSEAGKLLLMRALVQRYQEQLHEFAAAARSAGFAAQLVAAAEEMQVYGISAQQLEAAAEDIAANNAAAARRLQEIALLCSAYEQEAGGGYAERMQYLTQCVRAGLCADTQVYIDGYAEFTPCELEVIGALMQSCPRLSIALCLDLEQAEQKISEDDPFYPLWRTYGKLNDLAAQLGVVVETPLLLPRGQGRFRQAPVLAHLEQLLVRRGAAPWPEEAPQLQLWSAADRRSELETVGREIRRLVREEGLRYREIAVLCRDSRLYEGVLADSFEPMQIPYFIDSKKTLLYHPLVELLRALLEVWVEGPAYRPMLRLLKNRLSPIFGAEADLLDNYCLAHGVRFYHWQRLPWQFALLQEDGETEEMREQINDIAQRAAGPVLSFLAAVGESSKAAQVHAAFRCLLEQWQVDQRLQDLSDSAFLQGDETAAQHEQVRSILEEFFAEAEECLADTVLTKAEIRDLYETALSGLTFSTIPPGLDQVMIGSLERSRNPELRAVFLIGVAEGELPRRIVAAGLFHDEERSLLASRGLHLADDTHGLQFKENYLAYIGLTRSSERLYVSYPRSINEQETQPSPLLRRLRAAFPQVQLERVGMVDRPCQLVGGAADIDLMSAALREEAQQPLWQAVYAYYQQDDDYTAELAQVRRGWYFHADMQPLSPLAMQKLHHGVLRGSVSRLEKFRQCPFSFYAAYDLKLKGRREFGLTARERGDLYHYVLSDIGAYLRDQHIGWSQVDEQLAGLLVDSVLEKYLPQFLAGILSSSARYAYLAGRLRRALISAVLLVASQLRKGQFVPVAYELDFGLGRKDGLPAFVLPLPDGRRLELSGRIDRVDMAEDAEAGLAYFRIIDYKTGQASIASEDVEAGLKLQLMVYLQVVLTNSAVFTARQPRTAGVYYINVNDSMELLTAADKQSEAGIRANGLSINDAQALYLGDNTAARPRASRSLLSQQQLEDLQQRLIEVLQDTATAMLDGLINASPVQDKNNDACRYCDFRTVCGFDRQLAAKRTQHDLLPDKAGEEGIE